MRSRGFLVEPARDSAVRANPMTAASFRNCFNTRRVPGQTGVIAPNKLCDLSPSLPEFLKSLAGDLTGFFRLWIGDALCQRIYSYLQTEKIADDEDWIVAHDRSRFLFPVYRTRETTPRYRAIRDNFAHATSQAIENEADLNRRKSVISFLAGCKNAGHNAKRADNGRIRSAALENNPVRDYCNELVVA